MTAIDKLRASGWTVAVHNDYSLNDKKHTFWLLTHPLGIWVKGEGETDQEALRQIEGQIIHHVELEETLRKLVETARTCANDTECLELLEAVEEYEVFCGGTYAFQKK